MLPFYILIRTSKRPKYFEQLMKSISSQTYKNIVTIVHTDDENDNYVFGDIIVKSKRQEPSGPSSAPYNLYCNTLLDSIPEEDGWYHFMDDDDVYYSNDTIERMVQLGRKDSINVGKIYRGEELYPIGDAWQTHKDFITENFFLHTSHKNKARWWNKISGDRYYSNQLSQLLFINRIENLIITKTINLIGCGMRYDINDKVDEIRFLRRNNEFKKYRQGNYDT